MCAILLILTACAPATITQPTAPEPFADFEAAGAELKQLYSSENTALFVEKMKFEQKTKGTAMIEIWFNGEVFDLYPQAEQQQIMKTLSDTNKAICQRQGFTCLTRFYSPTGQAINEM